MSNGIGNAVGIGDGQVCKGVGLVQGLVIVLCGCFDAGEVYLLTNNVLGFDGRGINDKGFELEGTFRIIEKSASGKRKHRCHSQYNC